jgi:hypothetical protein
MFILLIALRLDDGWFSSWTRERAFVIGAIVGAICAPWAWLHFKRQFGWDHTIEEAVRNVWIRARALTIWQEEGKPEGRAEEHWEQAKKEFEEAEDKLLSISEKLGAQELERYKFASMLLGATLVAVALIPLLPEWFSRTQQVQAFGVSLTLISQRNTSPSLTPPASGATGAAPRDTGGSRLQLGMAAAYRIIPNQSKPLSTESALPSSVQSSNLSDIDNLSLFERDRAFIAWFEAEHLRKSDSKHQQIFEQAGEYNLADYVRHMDANSVDRRINVDDDVDFIRNVEPFSRCLRQRSTEINDPQLFLVEVGSFLRFYVGSLTGESRYFDSMPPHVARWIKDLPRDPYCGQQTFESVLDRMRPEFVDGLVSMSPGIIGKTPYPTLVAAEYLAAIDAVDDGVSVIEKWMGAYDRYITGLGDGFMSSPQVQWYQIRAMMSVTQLPYFFGGMNPSHRQLVQWQERTTDKFAELLLASWGTSWAQLCHDLLGPSLHNRLGRLVAFSYATERFYLFELLSPDDFAGAEPAARHPAKSYIAEAEMMRDNPSCFRDAVNPEQLPHYLGLFSLYIAQLEAALLDEVDKDSRITLIGQMRTRLADAKHYLGVASHTDEPSLIARQDIWERHRMRARLLSTELERINPL